MPQNVQCGKLGYDFNLTTENVHGLKMWTKPQGGSPELTPAPRDMSYYAAQAIPIPSLHLSPAMSDQDLCAAADKYRDEFHEKCRDAPGPQGKGAVNNPHAFSIWTQNKSSGYDFYCYTHDQDFRVSKNDHPVGTECNNDNYAVCGSTFSFTKA